MPKATNILITCAGRRVGLVRAFRAARDAVSPFGKVFCGDCDPLAPALAFADNAAILPRLGDGEYMESVLMFCKTQSVSFVVPTIDTELPALAEMRERALKEFGVRFLVSSRECVAICRDKRQTADFFAGNSIPAPATYLNPDAARRASASFPLIVKPSAGSSSIGVNVAMNWAELEFFCGRTPEPVIQEMLTGAEYTVDAFLDFGGAIVEAVPRRRIAVRSGEILKGQIDMRPQIRGAAFRVLEALSAIGAVGPVTLQGFLCGDGVFRFTEINPRFGGGVTMSIAAGADFPACLYCLDAGLPLPAIEVRDHAVFSRFDSEMEIPAV